MYNRSMKAFNWLKNRLLAPFLFLGAIVLLVFRIVAYILKSLLKFYKIIIAMIIVFMLFWSLDLGYSRYQFVQKSNIYVLNDNPIFASKDNPMVGDWNMHTYYDKKPIDSSKFTTYFKIYDTRIEAKATANNCSDRNYVYDEPTKSITIESHEGLCTKLGSLGPNIIDPIFHGTYLIEKNGFNELTLISEGGGKIELSRKWFILQGTITNKIRAFFYSF